MVLCSWCLAVLDVVQSLKMCVGSRILILAQTGDECQIHKAFLHGGPSPCHHFPRSSVPGACRANIATVPQSGEAKRLHITATQLVLHMHKFSAFGLEAVAEHFEGLDLTLKLC